MPVIATVYRHETVRLARTNPLAGKNYSYLGGLEVVARHDREGHPSYVLGKTSEKQGWWYYFPIAFAVKTPTAVLLLLLVSLLIVMAALRHADLIGGLRRLPFVWYVLAVPMGAFFLLSMRSHINIGL